jgi:hypothetical protein
MTSGFVRTGSITYSDIPDGTTVVKKLKLRSGPVKMGYKRRQVPAPAISYKQVSQGDRYGL